MNIFTIRHFKPQILHGVRTFAETGLTGEGPDSLRTRAVAIRLHNKLRAVLDTVVVSISVVPAALEFTAASSVVITDRRDRDAGLAKVILMNQIAMSAVFKFQILEVFVKDLLCVRVRGTRAAFIRILIDHLPVLRKLILLGMHAVIREALTCSALPYPEAEADVFLRNGIQENRIFFVTVSAFAHPDRNIQRKRTLQHTVKLRHLRNETVNMHLDAPVIAVRIIVMRENADLCGPDRALDDQQMIFVDLTNPFNQTVIEIDQLLQIFL